MTVKEIIEALSSEEGSLPVIVRLGDSLNVYEVPVSGFTKILYCTERRAIAGYSCKVDPDEARKKCQGCHKMRSGSCKQNDGIGQHMGEALLIDGEV